MSTTKHRPEHPVLRLLTTLLRAKGLDPTQFRLIRRALLTVFKTAEMVRKQLKRKAGSRHLGRHGNGQGKPRREAP
jgi:hypothetical protein